MVIFIFYLFIIYIIKYGNLIVPLWNFDSSTINLLSTSQTYEYTIYSFSQDSFSVNLKKSITKNTDGSISEKNTLIINSDSKETSWEDIHSSYGFSNALYICPKGKNHLNKYLGSNQFQEYIPGGFDYTENWELICYKQTVKNYLFVAYLNKYNKLFAFILQSNTWHEDVKTLYNGIFDFKWTESARYDNNEYPMRLLMYNNNKINLKTNFITIDSQGKIYENGAQICKI